MFDLNLAKHLQTIFVFLQVGIKNTGTARVLMSPANFSVSPIPFGLY
jgi:hypothetical protein